MLVNLLERRGTHACANPIGENAFGNMARSGVVRDMIQTPALALRTKFGARARSQVSLGIHALGIQSIAATEGRMKPVINISGGALLLVVQGSACSTKFILAVRRNMAGFKTHSSRET